MIRMAITDTPEITPPRLIDSFVAGFNTVANNIYLIALPVLLDMLLWLGPHLSVKQFFTQQVNAMADTIQRTMTAENFTQWANLQQVLLQSADRLNIFGSLSTLPVGLPSLIAGIGAIETPLGAVKMVEVLSPATILGFTLLLTLLGFVAGAFYFNSIARQTSVPRAQFSLKALGIQSVHTLLLALELAAASILLAIPTLLLISVLALINPAIAQMAGMVIIFVLIWLLLPLVFTPHGIFANQQNSLSAILTSHRLVRRYLPGTGLFLLVALILCMGLDQLWGVPPENSWLLLIGIAGHAFIYTAVIASSFVYYRGGIHFMLQVQQIQNQAAQNRPLL